MNLLLAALIALPAVVMYHRVDAAAPSDAISQRLTISPAQFSGELRELQRMGLHTIGIADLARAAARGESLQRAVLLTFDDGYGDQFRYAFPILQRLHERATFFINTGTIGTPGHLTWTQVEAMAQSGMSIECHGVDHVDLGILGVDEQMYQIDSCIAELRAHLRGSGMAFAYPSGAFDSSTITIVRDAGVLFGFTTDPRFQTDVRSPFQITRIRVLNGMSDGYFASLVGRARSYVDFSSAPPPADRVP
ncbi:MAG: polysaccharide deacetylase family protein [Candidatus Eremiobacteraeota bacterium]|nr:polysaccharide deacetylase family protein [Candidatus Eremiobacteraeota bacterium]